MDERGGRHRRTRGHRKVPERRRVAGGRAIGRVTRPAISSRRRPVRRLPAVTLIVIVAGLLMALDSGWAQKGPIKIGLILPETGPLAANGKDMANGLQLFFEEQGWKLAGREVKLNTEDDEGKPPTGLAKARSLVESQGVHVLMGPLSAAVGYAV